MLSLRFFLAHIFFALAVPTSAQKTPVYTPEKVESEEKIGRMAEQLEQLKQQTEEARYAKDIAEMKLAVLDSQTSWFEILTSSMIGLFGALITVVVIFFTIRFGNEAKRAAIEAAKGALAKERGEIQTLLGSGPIDWLRGM